MSDINIEEILKTYSEIHHDNQHYLHIDQAKAAIKKIVELVVDKCAEEAEIQEKWWDGDCFNKEIEMFHENGDKHTFSTSKSSIIKVKTMVKYE